MDTIYEFNDEISIRSSSIRKISNDFFNSIKKELPKEALNYVCITFILDEIREQVKSKPITL